MNKTKFFGFHITQKMKWTTNVDILKQRIYNLSQYYIPLNVYVIVYDKISTFQIRITNKIGYTFIGSTLR
jgi:hypothetical protein